MRSVILPFSRRNRSISSTKLPTLSSRSNRSRVLSSVNEPELATAALKPFFERKKAGLLVAVGIKNLLAPSKINPSSTSCSSFIGRRNFFNGFLNILITYRRRPQPYSLVRTFDQDDHFFAVYQFVKTVRDGG